MGESNDVDAARRELAPAGVLRAAINTGNPALARPNPDGGEPLGLAVDIGHELGRYLGVPVAIVQYASAGNIVAALDTGAWDVAFLAIDPARAERIAFTTPYLLIEGTYAVRGESAFTSTAELDRDGVTIAVGKNAAYDLYLTRALRSATIVRAATSAEALDMFALGDATAVAGVRQALNAFAHGRSGVRVLPDRFMVIGQAIATAKEKQGGARGLQTFLDRLVESRTMERMLNANA